MKRKKVNLGKFGHLKVPMQKREVERICRDYGFDISGLIIKIQRDESMINSYYTGSTDYDNVGRIDLFPNAFINTEQVLRTLIHEKAHVLQLRKYGKNLTQININFMEKVAYRFEELFYKVLLKRRENK